jgi:coatomer subunit zeta
MFSERSKTSHRWLNVSQLEFERNLFKSSSHLSCKGDLELMFMDQHFAAHKASHDLRMFVVANQNENEIILVSVLEALFESLTNLLRGVVDKLSALENLDLVLLVLDELVDGGIILETDPYAIIGRVAMNADSEHNSAEQTISQALASARDQLSRNLLR